MDKESFVAILRDSLGQEGVLSAQDIAWPHWWSSTPLCVVCPKDVSEVRTVVRVVESAHAGLIPVGGGTRLHTGYSPNKPSVGLSTQRLNALVDYQPEDLTITVQAGLTLAEVQRILGERKQRLALDVPFPARATLGGIVASAQSGFLRTAYGTPRDLLIGVRAVMTGGAEVKGGGKVVKNVAGYDICKLFTGSWGTLGILTELTFKVHTAPAVQRVIAWDVDDLGVGARIAFELYQAQLAAVGYIVTNELESRPQIVVLLEGTAKRVDWQTEAFEERIRKQGVTRPPKEISLEERQTWQDALARLTEATPLAVRISCLPLEVPSLLERMRKIPTVHVTADCACGIVELAADKPDHLSPQIMEELLPSPTTRYVWTRLDPIVSSFFEAERWGRLRADFGLQKRLKEALDPLCTFSPGRFIGRL